LQSPLGRAAGALAPVVLASIGLVSLGLGIVSFINSEGLGYDFRAYDDAARRIASGAPLYLPGTVDAYTAGRYEGLYLYPPPPAVALLPLTLVGQQTATVVWLLVRAGLLVAGCLALPVAWRARAVVLGVAGLSFPVLFDLNIGNVNIVVFALCVVAWRWMNRPIAAIAHAALIAIRFPFGIFAVTWLVQRRWRTLGLTIAAGLALIVISLPFVGLAAYQEYVAIILGLPDISVGEHNQSLKSLALLLGAPDPIAGLVLPLGYVLGLGAVAIAAQRRDGVTAFVVTVLATLLVSPFIHPHYLVLLLLPAALLIDRGHWWAAALPLLGWLPDDVLPLVGPLSIGLVLWSRDPEPASRAAS
jgi:hypothetical protein